MGERSVVVLKVLVRVHGRDAAASVPAAMTAVAPAIPTI
jgi:hypothetical protein